ncbi:MAG: helix-turn-helix transcriptional regulator, partial [Acidimicrobiales bacterium]
IENADPALVETAFQLRRQERVGRARQRLDGLALADQVVELTAILDEDGYLSDCAEVAPGSWQVTEHNCAILDVAQRYGTACGTELAFIREVLPGATVERIAHRLNGAHVCAYAIAAR